MKTGIYTALYIRTDHSHLNKIYRDHLLQEKEIKNKLTLNEDVKLYCDIDCSNNNLKNETLQKLINDIEKKLINKVIIYDYWVISSEYTYFLEFKNILKQNNTELKMIHPSYIAAYLRVSTLKQAEDGIGLEMQKKVILNYVNMIDLVEDENEIKFYVDDGYSGSNLSRPAMKSLVDDIKCRRITFLLCYDFARISRDIFDSQMFLKLINKHNVYLKSVNDEIKTKTASDRCTTNMKMVINQYEREKIIERTNDGLLTIASQSRYPCGGKPAFGWYRGKDKDIYINEEEAIIVRHAINMAKKGRALDDIQGYMNTAQNARFFEKSSILNMINDIKYAGIFKYKGKIYYDIVPVIVALEDLNEARKHIKKKKFKLNDEYLFDNLVYCHNCGSPLSCTHGNNKNNVKYYYYKCRNCSSQISQKTLENYLITKEDDLHNIEQDYITSINQQIYKIQEKIDSTRMKFYSDHITDKEYASIAMALEDQLNHLEIKKKVINHINKKDKYNPALNNKEKKEYINQTIKKIIVDPHEKKIIDIEFK